MSKSELMQLLLIIGGLLGFAFGQLGSHKTVPICVGVFLFGVCAGIALSKHLN